MRAGLGLFLGCADCVDFMSNGRPGISIAFGWTGLALIAMPLVALGCRGKGPPAIRVEGSDTMVNVAQAWAEEYHQLYPDTSVQVLGGGSGVGIASLIDGNCDLADSSRKMKPTEIEKASQPPRPVAAGVRGGLRRPGRLRPQG